MGMSNEIDYQNGNLSQEASDAQRREVYLNELKTRFVSLPTDMLLDRQRGKLTPQDIYFYCYLLAKQGHHDCLWWGYESLELITGLTESVMKESVKRLLACGHIKRKRRRDGTTITFCLTFAKKEKGIYVRGFKVADAWTPKDSSTIPMAVQNSGMGAPSDRKAYERSSSAQADSSLN